MKHCNHAVVWHRFHTVAPGHAQCVLFGSSVHGWRLSDCSSWCSAACAACRATGRAGTSSLTVCGVWWAGTSVDALGTATQLRRCKDNNCDTELMQHDTGWTSCVCWCCCASSKASLRAPALAVCTCASTPTAHAHGLCAPHAARPHSNAALLGTSNTAAQKAMCTHQDKHKQWANVSMLLWDWHVLMFVISSTARASACCNCEGAHNATCDVWCDEVVR